MAIGPFSTYAPPGVYTQTSTEVVSVPSVAGARIPFIIGPSREYLNNLNVELVRGSSSQADTRVFNEDATGRWVTGGTVTNPTLGGQNGSLTSFRVRNYPIVDGTGVGRVTYSSSSVSVTVNGLPVPVASVNGATGVVSLLTIPAPSDIVYVTYYYHRSDTRATDDVSAQVSSGVGTLISQRPETYVFTASNNVFEVYVNDSYTPSVISLSVGTRYAADIVNDINAALVSGLTASVVIDNQGYNHVMLSAAGNLTVGSGTANGQLGFTRGDSTNRNRTFTVYNGPIVDGSGGGITTNDPTKVTVTVNGITVIAQSVDGKNRKVTLPAAPVANSTVTVSYFFNTWQDTFDYLPNANVTNILSCGIGPSRTDYRSGVDFTIDNSGAQSFIKWGTSFTITPGLRTGDVDLGSSQISAMLVDDKIYGAECERTYDANSPTMLSSTIFQLPYKPTTGNGRDTPLGTSVYASSSNNRLDLPTDRPDLIEVYVGKDYRDAVGRNPVTVMSVDSATNYITLKTPVPADYKVFANFWYSRIADSNYTFSVVTPGPSGTGTYSITSSLTGGPIFGVTMGTITGFTETLNWPSGSATDPRAFHSGLGTPVAETVTVTFNSNLAPATHATITSGGSQPYEIFDYTRNFGEVLVDGSPYTVDLSVAFPAAFMSSPVDDGFTFNLTDRIALSIDGVLIDNIDISSQLDMLGVATAINNAVDADTQAHEDGTGTFASTAPNNLASVVTYGDQVCLQLSGRNIPSISNGYAASLAVLTPSLTGSTNAAATIGLSNANSFEGSYTALNKAAEQIGTKVGPFDITAGSTDVLTVNIDGSEITTSLPAGSGITTADVVAAINEGYLAYASASDITTYTTQLINIANSIKANYNTHRVSTTFHDGADNINVVSTASASNLATALTLLNDIKTNFNAHLVEGGVHQLNDTFNSTGAASATNLVTAVTLAYELKKDFNLHLLQIGVHGHDDTSNLITSPAASDYASACDLAIDLKTQFNSHIVFGASHLASDSANTVTAADPDSLNPGDQAVLNTLLNQIKTKFNLHIVSSGKHTVNDPNAVSTANASDLATSISLANALSTAYSAHQTRIVGSYHVHGTKDLTNTVTTSFPGLIAFEGQGKYAGKLILRSRLNTQSSIVSIKSTSTALDTLGFTSNRTTYYTRPTASLLTSALTADASFSSAARVAPVAVSGLGTYLTITSLSSGGGSSISFASTTNTSFLADTGLGIVIGSTGDTGESAISGFSVSSNNSFGSSGTGIPGRTYNDSTTGLTFTLLESDTGDYTSGGSFTMNVSPIFTADSVNAVVGIPGLEVLVTNLNNTQPGTTATIRTFKRTGSEPAVGDVYYISYEYSRYGNTSAQTGAPTGAAVFTDMKSITRIFGPANTDNPLSLAASLAFLNGAPAVGLRQVFRSTGSSQASVTSYIEAIDELKKPVGTVKPATISVLTTEPTVLSYLAQHVIFMSTPRQEGERVAVIGTAVGTTPTGVQSLARGFNSDLVWVVYPDAFTITTVNEFGVSTESLVDGTYAAVALAASTCSPAFDVASPLTRRAVVGFTNIGRYLDPTEANQVAVSGVTVLERVESGIRVRHGLTTQPENVITRTPSVVLTIQYVQQTLRSALDPFIGSKFTPDLVTSVRGTTQAAFNQMIGDQIVGQLGDLSVATDPDDPTIMRVNAVYVPVFPLEYIAVSLSVRVRI